METKEPNQFKHTTLDKYPDTNDGFVGVTLLDEEPGFTGVYMRTKEGLLWPARTINHDPPAHHRKCAASWMKHEVNYFEDGQWKRKVGDNRDERTVKTSMEPLPQFYECQHCGSFHPADYEGHCTDQNRFLRSELDQKFGSPHEWEEILDPELASLPRTTRLALRQ